MRRNTAIAGFGLALALSVGGASASAETHRASISGKVQADSNLTLVTAWDRGDDGQWVRANWNTPLNGTGGVDNRSGYNTTAQRSAGSPVTAVQACHSRTLQPMACSNWNNVF
jgi:hypothetical protein